MSGMSRRKGASGERELALERPRVEMDPETLERGLDPFQHRRHRIGFERGELRDVRALVSVLGQLRGAADLLEVARPHGGAENLHLAPSVVEVVLAADRVAPQLEHPR